MRCIAEAVLWLEPESLTEMLWFIYAAISPRQRQDFVLLGQLCPQVDE